MYFHIKVCAIAVKALSRRLKETLNFTRPGNSYTKHSAIRKKMILTPTSNQYAFSHSNDAVSWLI